MKPSTAFDVCHEVYAAAREIVNTRMPTLQLDRASKFLWRPDLHPRLVEYVADFALAGARALGEDDVCGGGRRAATDKLSRELRARWRPRRRSRELRASRLAARGATLLFCVAEFISEIAMTPRPAES
jgi:hypothetical protein